MSIHERRQRAITQRHNLILSTARRLAEERGWAAVTTRKLADAIEYSQPVLYSHFKNRDELIRAVATQGFKELTELQREARAKARTPTEAIRLLARVYHQFANENPRLYEAMFVNDVGLSFATKETPEELHEAFGELLDAASTVANSRDPEVLAELIWATLHGVVSLGGSGRLRPEHEEARLDMLVDALLGLEGEGGQLCNASHGSCHRPEH